MVLGSNVTFGSLITGTRAAFAMNMTGAYCCRGLLVANSEASDRDIDGSQPLPVLYGVYQGIDLGLYPGV